jgi:hypothetical protein
MPIDSGAGRSVASLMPWMGEPLVKTKLLKDENSYVHDMAVRLVVHQVRAMDKDAISRLPPRRLKEMMKEVKVICCMFMYASLKIVSHALLCILAFIFAHVSVLGVKVKSSWLSNHCRDSVMTCMCSIWPRCKLITCHNRWVGGCTRQ